MADNNPPMTLSPRNAGNGTSATNSPRIPRHATQVTSVEHLTPERKAAVKVPPHATQVLPDVLTHAQEELVYSPVPIESNFVAFEKHLLANHIGSLGDYMIYEKNSHREEDDPQVITESKPNGATNPPN